MRMFNATTPKPELGDGSLTSWAFQLAGRFPWLHGILARIWPIDDITIPYWPNALDRPAIDVQVYDRIIEEWLNEKR